MAFEFISKATGGILASPVRVEDIGLTSKVENENFHKILFVARSLWWRLYPEFFSFSQA